MPIILIIIALILIIYSYKSMKKENNLNKNNDMKDYDSFQSILRESESDLSDYKFELGVLRKDIGESLNELQQEIVNIKKTLNLLDEKDKIYEQLDNSINENYYNESSKASKIRKLLEDGLTDEEISEKLSVAKGEILLVKGLYKQQ